MIDEGEAFLYVVIFDAKGEKTMQRILDSVDFHFISGFPEPFSVGFPFIPQGIELGRKYQCPGLTGQILCKDGGKIRIQPVGLRTLVIFQILAELLSGKQEISSVFLHGRERGGFRVIAVYGGVDQDLLLRHEFAPVPGHQGEGCRQVAAGAVADEGDAGRIHIEQKTVLINRPRHSVAVLKPRREAEFRRQPVAYGNYRVPRVPGKPRADPVIGIHTFRDPAASVQEQEHREGIPLHSVPGRKLFAGQIDAGGNLIVSIVDLRVYGPVKTLQRIDCLDIGKSPGGLYVNVAVGQRLEDGAHRFVDCHL